MSLLNFTSLDFDQIKDTLKQYLQSNSNFTDYDFEGSNLSTILDVLAYNTYITSYNANMISNEVFIDSATLRENVVALARNIGYVPRSKKASTATVNFTVEPGITPPPTTITLKKGPVAASNAFGGQSFTFGVTKDVTKPVIDGVASFLDLDIKEGTVVDQKFPYSTNNINQRFILSNAGIDLSTLEVYVRPSATSSLLSSYTRQDSLFDAVTGSSITKDSLIYYIQEIEDEQYELIFGDGIFGKELSDGNIVEVSYILTNGSDANGISNLSFAGKCTYTRNAVENTITSGISIVTANIPSTGGDEIESVDSVKKFAPQIYSTQNRALTSNDYEILIPNKIYPETESISVYGGEELVPPQYGKVFISIKPRTGDFVPNAIKENIKRDLRKYSVAGIVPEILDLKYLYLETESKVYYNTSLAPNPLMVSSTILNNINKLAASAELNKYGARFKYSKFLKVIDQSHESITSNITTVEMRRDLRLAIDQFAEYAIDFGNEFHISSMDGFNIRSTAFRVLDIGRPVYLYDLPNTDRNTGSLGLFSLDAPGSTTPLIERSNVGVVNYKTGRITLNPINIVSGKTKDAQQIMEISVVPHSNDVIGLQDLYLQLDTSNVEMVVDEIASGADPSGSTYTVTSSYTERKIVR
mgnify:CR=1 FL=1|jgi:hypothetical protein